MNPAKLEPYWKAQEMRAEAENNRQNTFAWLIGFYTQRAVGSIFPKSPSYFKKPIDLYEKPKTDAQKFAEYVAEFKKRRAEDRERNG